MADRGRVQRLMVCGVIACGLMAALVFSCAACVGSAPAQRRTIPVTTIPLLPVSEEAMCFDRLEEALLLRNAMLWELMECGETAQVLAEALIACEADKPDGLYVEPWLQRPPGNPQSTFAF